MFKTRAFLILFVILGGFFGIKAQTTFTSVEEAWQYACTHNIQIKTATLNTHALQAAQRSAYSSLLPQANATGQFTDNWGLATTLLPAAIIGGKKDTYIPVKFGQQYVYNAGITAQMDVLNVGTWFNIKIAVANTQLAKAQTGQNTKTVFEQVATQYYSLALAERAAQLATMAYILSDSVYLSAYEKYSNGLLSDPALKSTEINRLKSAQNRDDAHYTAHAQRNTFKLLLDLPLTDSLALPTPWVLKDEASVLNKSFAQHPAVQSALWQYSISQQTLNLSKTQFFPILSLIANVGTQQNNNAFKPFTNDVAWYQSKYWGVKLNVPLFYGGNHVFQWQKNKAMEQEAALQYDYTKKQADVEDNNLLIDYFKYHNDVVGSDKVLQLYLNIFQHKKRQYTEGLASLDDVNMALSDYINYQNTYLTTLVNYYITLYKIKIRQTAF